MYLYYSSSFLKSSNLCSIFANMASTRLRSTMTLGSLCLCPLMGSSTFWSSVPLPLLCACKLSFRFLIPPPFYCGTRSEEESILLSSISDTPSPFPMIDDIFLFLSGYPLLLRSLLLAVSFEGLLDMPCICDRVGMIDGGLLIFSIIFYE